MESITDYVEFLFNRMETSKGEYAPKAKAERSLKEWQSFKERYPRLVELFEGD